MTATSHIFRLSRLMSALAIMVLAWAPMHCAAACDHAADGEVAAEQRVDFAIPIESPSREQESASTACASCCVQILVGRMADVPCANLSPQTQTDFVAALGAAPPGMVLRPPIV